MCVVGKGAYCLPRVCVVGRGAWYECVVVGRGAKYVLLLVEVPSTCVVGISA